MIEITQQADLGTVMELLSDENAEELGCRQFLAPVGEARLIELGVAKSKPKVAGPNA